MRSCFIVFFILCLIPVCLCYGNGDVYATFDGGTVTNDDIRGYIDAHSKVFPGQGEIMDFRNEYGQRDHVLQTIGDIAFGHIAAKYLDENDLKKDPFAWSAFQEMRRKIIYTYLQLDHTIPQIHKERNRYEARIQDYYREHKETKFKKPEKVSFQIIFFNLKDVTDEAVIEKKRKKADELAGILKTEPGKFESFAEQYSEVDFKDQGALKMIGPYTLKQLDDNLETALEQAGIGEITPAVRTKNGFIIARLGDRKVEYKSPEEVRAEIVKEIGSFSGQGIDQSFFLPLGGGREPEVAFDDITSDPLARDLVVAKADKVKMTNADLLFIFNADSDYNAILKEKPAEEWVATQFVGPVFQRQCIALNAEKRGLLNTPRFKRMEQVSRDMFLSRFLIEQFDKGLLKKQFPDPGIKKIKAYLLDKHGLEITKVPGVDELFN